MERGKYQSARIKFRYGSLRASGCCVGKAKILGTNADFFNTAQDAT
jgi:hypothetical protein